MQIIINIDSYVLEHCKRHVREHYASNIEEAIADGTPIPEGHGDLIDKNDILAFLKCPKYDSCDWKNCYECNKRRCININNINSLVPIISADTENEV